jgi:hypothetical protein
VLLEVHHTIRPIVVLPEPADVALYGYMRADYVKSLKRVRNPASRTSLAMKIGAEAFGVPIEVLQGPRNQKQADISEMRQKLMAFVRVVSLSVHPERPNAFKQIARAFNRKHPCIIHATHKYGSQITAALEVTR